MAAANATAALIALNTTNTTAKFTSTANTSFVGSDDVSGSWSRSGNTLTWTGANPSIQASSSVTVNALQVTYAPPLAFSGVLANISHADVSLTDGDTIIYTNIEFDQETPDLS